MFFSAVKSNLCIHYDRLTGSFFVLPVKLLNTIE